MSKGNHGKEISGRKFLNRGNRFWSYYIDNSVTRKNNQMCIGTSEKLLTSIIKQNWRQESIGVHVQNIQNFLIADREPI